MPNAALANAAVGGVALALRAACAFVYLVARADVAVRAQDPPQEPAATVTAFAAAFKAGRFAEAAALLAPERLDQLRKDAVESARGVQAGPRWRRQFAGFDSVATLERAPISELALAWLIARDPVHQARRQAAAGNCLVDADSVVRPLLLPTIEILGAVLASDRLAYVLMIDKDRGALDIRPTMVDLRRGSDGWRIIPRDDLIMGTLGLAGLPCRRTPPGRG